MRASPSLLLAFLLACQPEQEGEDAVNTDADCLTDAEEADLGTDPALPDSDDDGLDDCEEVQEFGTDPLAADGDGDGLTDAEELDCVSDPNDGTSACYACGWAHNDPGDLDATGDEEGDVIANLELIDQCGEVVNLWDFAGEYHILFMTAAW